VRTVWWRGRGLASTPLVAAAFAAGELSADRVDRLLAAQSGRAVWFARDEGLLVTQAQALRFAEMCKALDDWRHRVDAEQNPDGPQPALVEPSLTLTPVDGGVIVSGELDPVGAKVVISALDAVAAELAPAHPGLSVAGLRPVALIEMARRAMAVPNGARPARVVANEVLGFDAFAELCELSNGTVIRPGHLVPYVDALDVRSIVFDSATNAVATSKRRTFVGALRAVVEVRDRHCQHPSGCDEPIDGCDVDHIVAWSQGGVTSQDNGQLLCRYHNRIEPQHARPPNTGGPDDTGEWRVIHIDFAELHTIDVNELLA
jgi:hypothetical protein